MPIFRKKNTVRDLNTTRDTLSSFSAQQPMDKVAFELIYDRMAEPILQYINTRIRDKEVSEGIVQEIFMSLWTRREELTVDSIESYMYTAAKFQILKYIRSKGVRQKYLEHFVLYTAQLQEDSIDEIMNAADLRTLVEGHIQALPPKCQLVFRMSRFEYKSISEIAEEMGISPRTVENYITRALKHLREELVNYPLALLFLLMFPFS